MTKKITIIGVLLFFAAGLMAQETIAEAKADTTGQPILAIDYGQPKTFEIANISVSGTQYLNHELLVDNSGLSVGQIISIPGDEISDAINRLWKLGLFENIQVRLEKAENIDDPNNRMAWLNINLIERDRIATVAFDGATSTEVTELTDALKLIKGKPFTNSLRLNINKIIKDFYARKGFLNAKSSFAARPDTVNLQSIHLTVNVNKGQRVKISNIVFEGNENLPSHSLKKQMKGTKEKTQLRPLRPSDFRNVKNFSLKDAINKLPNLTLDDLKAFADNRLSFQLFNSSKYDKKTFEEDKRSVIIKYNEAGYRDAEVTFDTIYTADPRNIIVKANIDEGRKYYFRNVTFKGNTRYSDEILENVIGIQTGDIYNETLLEERTTHDPSGRDISSLYMDDGYLFFRAIPVEKAIIGDSVDVEIFVNEGKQATIGEVIILGNDKTHEHVIRRELYTVPGDKFSRKNIIASRQRIAGMGFFDETQIGVRPINVNESTGKVDLEYTVVEKSNDQVQMQFGYGGERVGVVGQLGLTLTNFSANKIFEKGAWRPLPTGDAQNLSINASLNSLTQQTYSFSFTEPWLGGKRANSLSLGFFKQNFNFFNNPFNPVREEKIGKQNTTGGSISIGKRLNIPDQWFLYQAGISYQSYDLENSNAFIIRDGNSKNIALTQAFGRNSIGQTFYPYTGSKAVITAKITPPYSLWRDKSKYQLQAGEDATLITAENQRRLDEKDRYGGYWPLVPDGKPIPNGFNSRLLIATERDFLRNEENKRKYEFVEYHKWRFDSEWFQRLGNSKFVLRPYAKLGYVGSYNKDIFINPNESSLDPGNDGISPFERFRFGGDGLTQGFSTFGTTIISQRGYDDDNDYPLNSRGGYPIFNKFGTELRYLLSGEGSTPIYALTFLEGGNAYRNFEEYDPFNLKKSAGIGLRLQLPFFGLIGFDYGVAFDKDLAPGAGFGERSQFNLILGVQPE